jgi:cyclopropane-fatty-acyl-phospholipid synthase
MPLLDSLLAGGRLPDPLIRAGIRRLLRVRARDIMAGSTEERQQRLRDFIAAMATGPIAVATQESKEQHYEVPTRFYELCLGPHLKYSSAYYDATTPDLGAAEARMLALTAERAAIRDGEKVLELGCGWGSLTLFLAERFPKAHITGVSHSRTQRAHILAAAEARGLANVSILTEDMRDFDTQDRFDRVVSVEMFEHMRNWQALFGKINTWLKPEGTFFMHVFTHREAAYLFEVQGEDDWMGRYFFTGGMMPSDSLALSVCAPLKVEDHWHVSGSHYGRTSEAWLANMDRHQPEILDLFAKTYGPEQARKWWSYWRVFFMACAELWSYKGGEEWIVSHYRFRKQAS